MKALLTVGLVAASALLGTAAQAKTRTCTILTVNGHFLTAVGGGGRIDDVIHSDATQAKS